MKTAILLEQYLMEHAERHIVSVETARIGVMHLTSALGRYDHTRLTRGVLRLYRYSEGLAPATINREFATLRAALRYAVQSGRIRSAPPIPSRPGVSPEMTWLRPEQVALLLEVAERINPSICLFIRLALLTGQRLEAILSLRWKQVDWKQGVVWFSDHGLGFAERRKGRGDVPISAGLKLILEQHRNDSPFVMVSERGCRFRDINRRHWRQIITEAGVPDLTPHNLRHTVATNLLRDGVPLLDVSKLLGHANTAITEKVYLQYQPSFLTAAVGKLDTLVAGSGQ